jgi:hypothetical protein
MSLYKTQDSNGREAYEKQYSQIITWKSKIMSAMKTIKEGKEILQDLITEFKANPLYIELADEHVARIDGIINLKSSIDMEYEAYDQTTKDLIAGE